MVRAESSAGRWLRRGFDNPTAAEKIVADWSPEQRALLDLFDRAADPDLALAGVQRVTETQPSLLDEMLTDSGFARRVIAVAGGSTALQQHLSRRPEAVQQLRTRPTRTPAARLRADFLRAVGADPDASLPVGDPDLGDELRHAYRDAVVRVAARDLVSDDPLPLVEDVSAELSDIADAVLEAALAIARGEEGPEAERCRLAVVALGKCGAGELNYISDVDVLFVAEPATGADGEPLATADEAVAIGTRLAAGLSRVCSAHTAAGTIWPVDAALRPEGKAGPLVRTLAGMETYYQNWAKAWEFQAMLKARPSAGDLALAQDFCDLVSPLVWQVGDEEHFVPDTQAMRKRVVSLIPAKEAGREIKLGEGGLRDVEFTVQLLQLVHGRTDERLRHRGTFPALQALIDYGYVGRVDGAEFAQAYRMERALEHRVQLSKLRRSHLIPSQEADRRRLGRAMGWLREPLDNLDKAWNSARRSVLALHRRLFYSPLLEAVASIPAEGLRLSQEAAHDRLKALGYGDPVAALRHIRALTQGVSRQAEIQRQLLPAMLGWFAEGANPDAGLLAFRQVSEGLGSTSWYLRALRDEGTMAYRLARVLTQSRYVVQLLLRAPQAVQLLADEADLMPRSTEELIRTMDRARARHDSAEARMDSVRALRRRELFRVAVGDILDLLDVEQVGTALSDLASATLHVGMRIVADEQRAELGHDEEIPAAAMVAMGRWGGREMSYSSDADVMFVIADGTSEAGLNAARKAITRLQALLSRPGPDPALELDASLRPEGKGGQLVRTESAYLTYYSRWSSTWESQALIRAAHGAGDREITDRLLEAIDRLRWPEGGLTGDQLVEIRKLKARMEGERLPRGTDPKRHTKLGPGGLSDVEWTVQLLQLQHAHRIPELRTTMTLPALRAARDAELIDAEDAAALERAWAYVSRLRNQIMLVRGRASDVLPHDVREQAAVAELMGHGSHGASHLTDEYRRITRQARSVVDRLFWGQ
ncbi:bifunctional [glutamine synthetase] adenylyltransferase/[glutamine synthetase]-adenylyl-L-tyrosine phosphorylase [Enemella sp. A6]|uniref:bifunctional [glutamine synthetase] adenylyltransferase/[glutamine synthetase]-adenylyl-L-tyrosine phosphorylase n=1 Tax=Enemella sp. A6 TaxID=3440152 RepID=UPI003EBFBD65